MTVALLIKVDDGLVLASDSASTLMTFQPDGQAVVQNVYNNANKIFNLHKSLPIGAMTWGLGNIGHASIATISKDLREHFHDSGDSWALTGEDYDLQEVAQRARSFIYEDRYRPLVETPSIEAGQVSADLGYLVAGYSSTSDQPVAYAMNMGQSGTTNMIEILPGDTGASWWGQQEAIARLLNGVSLYTPQALVNLGVGASEARSITADITNQVSSHVVTPAMPIQDAIDLAEFLVHATIQYVRFTPGSPTVGGPVEVATITRHEGFKWVKRKHFYDSRLNPPTSI